MKPTKERRQVEILSLISDTSQRFSVADLCEEFGVEVATIHRDLNELRQRGIRMHSVKGAVRLEEQVSEKHIQSLLSIYISTAGSAISLPRNIALTVKKLGRRTLPTFVTLVNSIEKRNIIELTYFKMFSDETVQRTVEPYDIIPASNNWRLVARSDGIYKQFIIENIKAIHVLDEHFTRSKEYDAAKLFRGGFDYWSGEEQHEVVLLFSKKVASIVTNTVWSEEQEIERQGDGSLLLRMKVNSLENTANWVMTWGGSVKVVKPHSLENGVAKKALGILRSRKQRHSNRGLIEHLFTP
jgi:predicted DNA-binding transcriptional regulator YafY